MQKEKRAKLWYKVYFILVIALIFLNVFAQTSTAFCDAYIKYVFPIWVNTYGRISNIFSFSVGEYMLLAGVLLLVYALLLGIVIFVYFVIYKLRRKHSKDTSKGIFYKKITLFCKRFYKIFSWIVLIVCYIMTLHCFILYHASTFSEQYFYGVEESYSVEELTQVRNYVVEQCNRLSNEMERDLEGNLVYNREIEQVAIQAMKNLGETYDQLDGYYPSAKPLAASDFFSQQYMAGYYFPFSMEANYNDVMFVLNKPSTICHELAHLRGYIFEDEANFISFLACIESEDVFFQYSGYLSVLYYLDNDFYNAVKMEEGAYSTEVQILSQVRKDNVFLTDQEWERINKKALIDTETVDYVSDVFTDTTLKVNGVEEGITSYNMVVKLLLQYYRLQ